MAADGDGSCRYTLENQEQPADLCSISSSSNQPPTSRQLLSVAVKQIQLCNVIQSPSAAVLVVVVVVVKNRDYRSPLRITYKRNLEVSSSSTVAAKKYLLNEEEAFRGG